MEIAEVRPQLSIRCPMVARQAASWLRAFNAGSKRYTRPLDNDDAVMSTQLLELRRLNDINVNAFYRHGSRNISTL